MAFGRLLRLVDRGLAPEIRSGPPEALLRARLFLGFTWVALVMAIAAGVSQALFGSGVIVACVAVCIAGVVATLPVVRRRGAVPTLTHALCGLSMAAVISIVIVRGGITRPVSLAVVVPPLLALLVAGRRAGFVWLGIAILLLSAVSIAQLMFGTWQSVELSDPVELNWAGATIYVVGVFSIAAAYEFLRENATRDLAAQHSALVQTEQRRAAMETEARLLRASRLSNLGTLAAGIAHEINNPLNVIYGNLTLLHEREPMPPDAELRSTLGRLVVAAERIRTIVQEIDTLARERGPNPSADLDVHAVLESSFELVRHEVREVELVRRYGDAPLVTGDAVRLSQIFVNILTNAAQAVRGRNARRIEVSTTRDGAGRAVIDVKDNGPGFSAEARLRAFEPFFTTKPEGEGSGLGLWVASSIAAQMGGHVEIGADSPGARVRLVLPARAGSAL